MKILNFEKDKQLNSAMRYFHKINNAIKIEHGQAFDFDPPKDPNATFKVNDKNSKFNDREIKMNVTIPSEELFSLAQELVKSADEPFAARQVFKVDNSFHEGSQTIGFDVEVEEGEAKLVASGRTTPTIPRADFKIGRTLNHVGKIMTAIEVNRDDVQQMDLRGARGLGPFVDLMQGKLAKARKHVDRLEDSIVWLGGDIENATGAEVQGLFNRLSTNSADFDQDAPTHGKRVDNLVAWDPSSGAGIAAIIDDIIQGVDYITRTNAYFPDTLVLPPSLLFGILSFARTSDTDSTPLVEWIKRAFKEAFNKELTIVASNAMKAGDVSGTERGNAELANDAFLLLEAKKEYQAIAVVEDLTMLPSKEDEQGTIIQVVQRKTGGLQVKHPGAMFLRDGIKAKT